MQCRIAPSLGGGFAGTPNEAWGTTDYVNDTDPAVFFGLYGLPDFYALWRHKGKKYILWAGTDILHFKNGYWLDTEGKIRMSRNPLTTWINENCESYVENQQEALVLKTCSLDVKGVVPSFLGDVNDYELCYNSTKQQYYTSVSGDDFETYGWDKIPALAQRHPEAEFHLYGNTVQAWQEDTFDNVIHHGRVPQEQMDAETKQMTGALRLTTHDGFSEILAKSLLWGQYPVSPFIDYPHIDKEIKPLREKPNTQGRDWLLSVVNKYPWTKN